MRTPKATRVVDGKLLIAENNLGTYWQPSLIATGVHMMLPLAVVVLASILAVKPAGVDPYLPIIREASASHQRCPEGVACD